MNWLYNSYKNWFWKPTKRIRFIFCKYIIMIYRLFISLFYKSILSSRNMFLYLFSTEHEYFIHSTQKKLFWKLTDFGRRIILRNSHSTPTFFARHSCWSNASKTNKYRHMMCTHNVSEGIKSISNRIRKLFRRHEIFSLTYSKFKHL